MSANNRKMTLLSLAIPILIEQILRSLMGTVNTFMLSRFSDDAAAAVGVANQVLNVMNMFSTMLASGAAVLINQNLGAGRDRDAARVTMVSLSASFLFGTAFSALALIFSDDVVRLMGLNGALAADAAAYLRVVGASCVIQFMSATLASHFRCRGKAQVAMAVIVFNNAVNLLGSWLVVHERLPLRGVAGIATVRLISETLGLTAILALFAREKWGQRAADLLRLREGKLGQIVSLGFMSGLEGISYMSAQLVTTRFITSLPTAVLSAKVAAQILCGHLIGAGRNDEAMRLIRRSWSYTLALNLAFSFAFYAFSARIVGLFTDSAEIQGIARTLFMIDIVTCTGRSMNHSYNFGLRSAGYVFWPMIIASASIWLLQVGAGYLFTVTAGLGVVGLWIGQALDEWVRGVTFTRIWLSRRWTRTSVVKPAE